MAQGVLIRDSQGNVQRVPFDQLQQADPMLYSQYVKNVAQPQAQLQETQASTGAAGASAAAASASAERTQHELAQQKAFDLIQKLFETKKGSDNKVSPDTYNSAKSTATSLGIAGDQFDKTFEQSYTNPQNYNYDTPSNLEKKTAYQQTKNALQAQIDNFNSIPEDQKGLFSKSGLAKIPYLGQIFAPQATEYEDQLKGLSAKLSDIAGGGQGSGLRITQTELNNWASLLPSPTKTKEQNSYDLQSLNRLMEAKFGKGNGIDSQYLPKQNRPPLASFNK